MGEGDKGPKYFLKSSITPLKLFEYLGIFIVVFLLIIGKIYFFITFILVPQQKQIIYKIPTCGDSARTHILFLYLKHYLYSHIIII